MVKMPGTHDATVMPMMLTCHKEARDLCHDVNWVTSDTAALLALRMGMGMPACWSCPAHTHVTASTFSPPPLQGFTLLSPKSKMRTRGREMGDGLSVPAALEVTGQMMQMLRGLRSAPPAPGAQGQGHYSAAHILALFDPAQQRLGKQAI
jgi:hypothetical protein